MKSIIIPNKTANITDPINAKKNIQPLNPPLSGDESTAVPTKFNASGDTPADLSVTGAATKVPLIYVMEAVAALTMISIERHAPKH